VAALNATRPEARAKVIEDIVLDDQYAMLRLKVVKRATRREEGEKKCCIVEKLERQSEY